MDGEKSGDLSCKRREAALQRWGKAAARKAAARKAANAKGVTTKKADKGVVRGAVTVMLMTAGSMLSAKLADAAAEQLRVEHEEFAVE